MAEATHLSYMDAEVCQCVEQKRIVCLCIPPVALQRISVHSAHPYSCSPCL